MKNKNLIVVLLLFIGIFTGCFIRKTGCIRKKCVEGIKESVAVNDLMCIRTYIDTVDHIKKEKIGKVNIPHLITVGHQLGNYQSYPKYPGNIKDTNFSSCKAMGTSFDNLGLSGVELDVQLGPDGIPYIVHEKITDKFKEQDCKWENEKIFFNNNTLEILLSNFIGNKGKVLYIELKAKKSDATDTSEIGLVKKILQTISEVISNRSDSNIIRESIAFVSFNHLSFRGCN